MNEPMQNSTTYAVDPEHGGLRLALLLVFFIVWVISYFVLASLIVGNGFNIIAVLVGLAIAFLATNLIERNLKARWPSGRIVIVDNNGVKLLKRGEMEQEMRADQNVSRLYWRFTIKKRSRVQKGWHMFACALEHEDRHLTVYTFLPPSATEDYDRAKQFTALTGKKETTGRTDLRLAGEQRRLRDAESYRWLNGAEMAADDFKRYVEQVQTSFPEWSPIE